MLNTGGGPNPSETWDWSLGLTAMGSWTLEEMSRSRSKGGAPGGRGLLAYSVRLAGIFRASMIPGGSLVTSFSQGGVARDLLCDWPATFPVCIQSGSSTVGR